MRRLPDLVFITDVKREDIAVQECNKLDIPIIAMVDTNCDPDPIDLVIPANDDAIRAIKLITGVIAQGAAEGQMMREIVAAEEEEDYAAAAVRRSRSQRASWDPPPWPSWPRGFDEETGEWRIEDFGTAETKKSPGLT